MTDSFILDPILHEPLLIVAALTILLVVIIVLELRKTQKFRAARLAASVGVVLALAGLFLRPSMTTEHNQSVLLLTPNFDKQQVDSVVRSLATDPVIYRLPDAASYPNAIQLVNESIFGIAEETQYVFGEGIPTALLDEADSLAFKYFPSEPKGIKYVNVESPARTNRSYRIKGIIDDSTTTKLAIVSAGGIEDSILIEQIPSRFELSFIPKQAGRKLYDLKQYHKDGTSKIHQLPVNVNNQRKLKVLGLFYYPTFEIQFLKTFLSDNSEIVLRYQVSKNDFRYEYINHKVTEARTLTPHFLKTFDLVLAGSDALNALSMKEKNLLEAEVSDGLGLLLLPDENPQKAIGVKKQLPYFTRSSSDTLLIQQKGKRKPVSFWKLTISDSNSFRPITKLKANVLSGYNNRGNGRIGAQLVYDTYKHMLEGDSMFYSSLWSDVIEVVSRRHKPAIEIVMKTPFPFYTDEPISFDVIAPSIPELYHDSKRVSVSEDMFINNLWHAKIWAGAPGWHQLNVAGDTSSFPFYVHEKDKWTSLKNSNTVRMNARLSTKETLTNTIEKMERISPIYFFLLFLLSAGFLWLAPKL